MARPKKEGMDYFPHDTDAVNDEKIESLRLLYGNDGYAFYFILLERIYRTKQFELDVSDAETIQILAKKVSVSEDKFLKMLETSLKRDCFDRHAYEERKVLTSEGIKKRASVVVDKRVKMRDKYQQTKEDVSDAETTQETRVESTQSKEKESKEKESINTVFAHWLSKGIIEHKKITSPMRTAINARLKDYSLEEVLKAIDNYSEVYKGEGYWFTHKYTLADFMRDKDIRKFLDEAEPLSNFKSNKQPSKQKQIDWEEL